MKRFPPMATVLIAALAPSMMHCDSELADCRRQEAEGVYLFNKNNACGCERRVCGDGLICVRGDCCSPTLDPDHCGCADGCPTNEVCHDNACCDPATATGKDNCGCRGKCEGNKTCAAVDEDGLTLRYACQCDPKLAQYDVNDCGCHGPCDRNTENCVQGECRCNPVSTYANSSDENCGCHGPCPSGAHCYDGVCRCASADQVVCNDACVRERDCQCPPGSPPHWARSDRANCGCKGACGSGEACIEGSCQCDPLAHAADNSNCACGGACAGENGMECRGGVCTCPPERLSDNQRCGCMVACKVASGFTCVGGSCLCDAANQTNNLNCGCRGACDVGSGYRCQGGQCLCDPLNQTNNLNCGCRGPCDVHGGYVCQGGHCTCDPANNSNNNNCACKGPCNTLGRSGYICDNGQCVCDPNNQSNSSNCNCAGACPRGAWQGALDWICQAGRCQCPPGTALCDAMGSFAPGVPTASNICHDLNLPKLCDDCITFCLDPNARCVGKLDNQKRISGFECKL